jgi:steroid delta-isomerase-like uncharacterized protein
MKKLYSTLLLAGVFAMSLTFTACDDAAKKAAELAEKNKAVCMKTVDVMNDGKVEMLDSLFAADYVEHTPDPNVTTTGLAAVKDGYAMMRSAFPDVKLIVINAVAEGDKVVIHQTFTGTNTGDAMGPATGKAVKADGVDIFIVKNGKITEHWAVYDSMTMMGQLGMQMVPAGAAMPGDSTMVAGGDSTAAH